MIKTPAKNRIASVGWLLMLAAGLALAGCARSPVHDLTPHELTNTITWSTASESDNFGFDVYRSESRDSPFVRITPRPMVGAGTTDVPRDYRFVDRNIEAGKVYFYYVESISLSGRRKRFTPIMEAPPKQPPNKTSKDG